MPMIEHAPHGDPCEKCGKPASRHRRKRTERAYHASVGDPCERCGKLAMYHTKKASLAKRKKKDKKRAGRQSERIIIGVDGEGHDLPDGLHVYTLLAAVDEQGKVIAEVQNEAGVSTAECSRLLLSLPKNALKVVFMGSYDWTKIIEDLPPADRYLIMRPEHRRVRVCVRCKRKLPSLSEKTCSRKKCRDSKTRTYTPHHMVGAIGYDWFNGSFTVAGSRSEGKAKQITKVWDVFRFFGTSFVEAVRSWKISTEGEEWFFKCPDCGGRIDGKCSKCCKKGIHTTEQLERILSMKLKRGGFQDENPEDVLKYCREECHLLAMMMRKVITSHKEAGIELKRYEGVGSSASALLKKHSMGDFKGPNLDTFDPELIIAIMSAYFGGRFENSVVGNVTEPVYGADISSAYPYAQATALPCLAHGRWFKARKTHLLSDIKRGTLAVCRFRVKSVPLAKDRAKIAWGPLPCRDGNGSIVYGTGFEGWAWRDEALLALKGWPDLVEILDAWIFESSCDHKPWAWVPDMYTKRCAWGKEGPGLSIKGAVNAGYGKTAQNAGDDPPFRSWIWAGMTTSNCRAQALSAILAAKNPWNILSIATDGVYSSEELDLPVPIETGTGPEYLKDEKGQSMDKPLGGWEKKTHPKGMFFVKPGMYFDGEMSVVRARGLGRREIGKHHQQIVKGFYKWDRSSPFTITAKSRRFYGARSSVLGFSQCGKCQVTWPGVPAQGCPKCGEAGDSFRTVDMKQPNGKIAYGQWCERDIKVEFSPLPKREHIDRRSPNYGRMRIRDMGGMVSEPYIIGRTTPEGLDARVATDIALEEPDWNDSEVELQ